MKSIAIGMILLAGLAGVAHGQDAAKAQSSPVVVRKLTVTATDKPNVDLHSMMAPLEGGSYTVEDLQDLIQRKFRDNGYYLAEVQTPQLLDVRQEGTKRLADVAAQVIVGDQYTMGQITFRATTQFKKEQMRSVFPIAAGSVFNASAISVGLEKLKGLYEAQGFADVGAVPSMALNEEKHVIDVSVEVEEGYPYLFGQLTLDGPEPVPGTSKALLAAWAEIAGRRYNPAVLQRWLAAHGPKSAPGAPALHPRAEGIANTEAHVMNVRLIF
ncbi:MAG: POTRA domain-containing protein [Terracidiphilus sp.]